MWHKDGCHLPIVNVLNYRSFHLIYENRVGGKRLTLHYDNNWFLPRMEDISPKMRIEP